MAKIHIENLEMKLGTLNNRDFWSEMTRPRLIHLKSIAAAAAVPLASACAADATETREAPGRVLQSCTSKSGHSQFIIDLNRATGKSKLRYQYLGQDVLYLGDSLSVQGSQITGAAVFSGSATGEVRGAPVRFAYDFAARTLLDEGASKMYYCDTLQDRSLVDLPNQKPR
jgi:hypothetical protein